jgi:AcrR family transcriptional regulator
MSSMPTELVEPTSVRRGAEQTRTLILDVAEELFYWNGIHATGVDRIAAAAKIGPTTLYRQFASKDDLVAAYVERYATGYRGWIETITSTPQDCARDRILALFHGLATFTAPETFRGCPFLMTLAEYPDPASAAHASAQSVKGWVRAKLHDLVRDLAKTAVVADPDALADQLALIVEGIYASTAALGVDGPANQARAIVEVLLPTM